MKEFDACIDLLSCEEKAILNQILRDDESVKRKDFNFIAKTSIATAKYCYEKWNPKSGDVFVISYPESSMLWTTELIRKILYADEETVEFSRNLPLPFKYIEVEPCEKFSVVDKFPISRRIFSSYLPAQLINVEKIKKANAKVVYILRNPKDQMLSLYKFLRSYIRSEIQPVKAMVYGGWDKYFDHVIAGDFPVSMGHGRWYPDHILSWYSHRDNLNIQFVHYEDLNKDLMNQTRQLGNFLNVSLSDERLNDILQTTKTATTSKYERQRAGSLMSLTDVLPILDRLLQPNSDYIGKWKHYFTVIQSEHIDEIIEEKLKSTDIKFA